MIRAHAGREGLAVVGAFHPDETDKTPTGTATLCLLGAGDGALWSAFSESPEAQDGAPHPMDRWSQRIITGLASRLGATPLFPFGGPPWSAFQHWAMRGEGAVSSPVGMQVTAARGLWASYRGALAFEHVIALDPPPSLNPCSGCAAPCRTACPVDAFAGGRYDVPRCTRHVLSEHGTACRDGCLVRSACPASAGLSLPARQRRFHMAAFLRANA